MLLVDEAAGFKLVQLHAAHVAVLQAYALRNREHLEPWEPQRSEAYYLEDYWVNLVQQRLSDQEAGQALHLLALTSDSDQVLAQCNFTNVQFGVACSANLGYSVDSAAQGRGLMTQVLRHALGYVFETLDLHRVAAAYMPENEASGRVLEKLGFVREGFARDYLRINGAWRDHVLTAKLNPAHR
ncbi:MAG: GNAT family N-acetyltransferase [Pseudomonadota bacterium]